MRLCPDEAIILCDNDGIVTEYNNYAKLHYPDIVALLSIEDVLGMGTIDHLKSL